MMASSLARALIKTQQRFGGNVGGGLLRISQIRCMGGHGDGPQPIKVEIGTREVVGFGNNGEENYMDDIHYPFPAIRFQEDSGAIVVSKYS